MISLRPFSIITPKCTHLLIDAGHISIESDLASKDAIRQIQLKRSQQYSDDDYARLESLMYDKLDLKLEDAQVKGPFSEIITTSLMFFAVHPWGRSTVLQKCAKLAR
jgi:Repeating coiled region of VPS13